MANVHSAWQIHIGCVQGGGDRRLRLYSVDEHACNGVLSLSSKMPAYEFREHASESDRTTLIDTHVDSANSGCAQPLITLASRSPFAVCVSISGPDPLSPHSDIATRPLGSALRVAHIATDEESGAVYYSSELTGASDHPVQVEFVAFPRANHDGLEVVEVRAELQPRYVDQGTSVRAMLDAMCMQHVIASSLEADAALVRDDVEHIGFVQVVAGAAVKVGGKVATKVGKKVAVKAVKRVARRAIRRTVSRGARRGASQLGGALARRGRVLGGALRRGGGRLRGGLQRARGALARRTGALKSRARAGASRLKSGVRGAAAKAKTRISGFKRAAGGKLGALRNRLRGRSASKSTGSAATAKKPSRFKSLLNRVRGRGNQKSSSGKGTQAASSGGGGGSNTPPPGVIAGASAAGGAAAGLAGGAVLGAAATSAMGGGGMMMPPPAMAAAPPGMPTSSGPVLSGSVNPALTTPAAMTTTDETPAPSSGGTTSSMPRPSSTASLAGRTYPVPQPSAPGVPPTLSMTLSERAQYMRSGAIPEHVPTQFTAPPPPTSAPTPAESTVATEPEDVESAGAAIDAPALQTTRISLQLVDALLASDDGTDIDTTNELIAQLLNDSYEGDACVHLTRAEVDELLGAALEYCGELVSSSCSDDPELSDLISGDAESLAFLSAVADCVAQDPPSSVGGGDAVVPICATPSDDSDSDGHIAALVDYMTDDSPSANTPLSATLYFQRRIDDNIQPTENPLDSSHVLAALDLAYDIVVASASSPHTFYDTSLYHAVLSSAEFIGDAPSSDSSYSALQALGAHWACRIASEMHNARFSCDVGAIACACEHQHRPGVAERARALRERLDRAIPSAK